jgi:GMP synthase (glutamine-hydrolysing)
MSKRILVVQHLPNEPTDDYVAGWLRTQNCRIDARYPSTGDKLPDPWGNEFDAVVIYGGVQNCTEVDQFPFLQTEIDWARTWIERDKPYLGFCLGGQIMSSALGGTINRREDDRKEIGYVPIIPTDAGRACGFMSEALPIFEWHQEQFSVPESCQLLATGGGHFPHQAISYGERAFGFQFHPEITTQLIKRWHNDAGDIYHGVPGADSQKKQIEDEARYQPAVNDWLSGFLTSWLAKV